jgi:hypothetical protein
MRVIDMTREQANNPDLVRGFKCGATGPVVYLGLMTREEVHNLQIQAYADGKKISIWQQAKAT